MKTLIVYYSFSGKTRLCAEALANELGADLRELKLKKEYRGALTYVFGGRDAFLKKKVELLNADFDFKPYDVIILASPVWAWTSTPPMFTFASDHGFSGKKVLVFVTCGAGPNKAVDTLSQLITKNGGQFIGGTSIGSSGKSDEKLKAEAIKEVNRVLAGQ